MLQLQKMLVSWAFRGSQIDRQRLLRDLAARPKRFDPDSKVLT